MPAHAVHLPAKERKDLILDAALRVSEQVGYHMATRKQIAEAAGVAPALVSARLGSMAHVRALVMKRAVSVGNVRVIGQGLANKDKLALKASDALKQAAAATLTR